MRALFFICLLFLCDFCCSYRRKEGENGSNTGLDNKMKVVFAWKQMSYDFDGVIYNNDTDSQSLPNQVQSAAVPNSDKFFIQYNNVPIGLEVYGDRVFVTVPNRRYGIPSTLNYVHLSHTTPSSPSLKPYPSAALSKSSFSTYRPRVDECGRLWVVDTGVLEQSGDRRQVKSPAVVVYDMETDKEILRRELNSSVLVNERTSAGLTSIAVEVMDPPYCVDSYAYINDLATEGLVVFSMKSGDSWRVEDPSFRHEASAENFTVAGITLPWKDGLFSISLSGRDRRGRRTAFYHALVSSQEFSVDTAALRRGAGGRLLGSRGPNSQSSTHGFHARTNTLLSASVTQDAITCWNVDTPLSPENVAVVAQDHEKMVYISDLKIVDDYVWVLSNQIPTFVYSKLNPEKNNYYVLKGKVQDLIKGTVCDRRRRN